MRILACSMGGEARGSTFNRGLRFLLHLISQHRELEPEIVLLAPSALRYLRRDDGDVLLVSLLCVDNACDYYRAIGGRKPPIRTILGGPGAIVCGVLRHFCDAVIVGRGEVAIFRALAGDYTGMATPGPTPAGGSVEVFAPTLLDPESKQCGCRYKCNFCTYANMNVYAADEEGYNGRYTISADKPAAEKILMDVTSEDLVRHHKDMRQMSAGLDGIHDVDLLLVRKPARWRTLYRWGEQILAQIQHELMCTLRLYVIVYYPWHGQHEEDFAELQEFCINTRHLAHKDCQIKLDLGPSHFIPSLLTPMEREPCRVVNMRDELRRHGAPMGMTAVRGFRLNVDIRAVRSFRSPVIETLLSRTEDPALLAELARCSSVRDTLQACERHAELLDRIAWRPQPWIRRANDYGRREHEYYATLHKLGFIGAEECAAQQAGLSREYPPTHPLLIPRLRQEDEVFEYTTLDAARLRLRNRQMKETA